MEKSTALYDLQGNFIMYGSLMETMAHLENVLITGTILKVSHLSIAQIVSMNLEQAQKLKKSYIVKD